MSQSPKSAQTELERGTAHLKRGEHELALACFSRAVALSPELVIALNNRGNALQALGRFDEAEADFRKAVSLAPQRAEIIFNLGNLLLARKQYDEARAAYDRAIAIKPDFAEAVLNRANALFGQGRFEEAAAGFSRAAALKPNFELAYVKRGHALHALERYAEAVASYDTALSLNPRSAGAHYSRGNALYEMGRFAEAIAAYTNALGLKPEFAPAFVNRGNTFSMLGRLAEARDDYTRALTLDPSLDYLEGNRLFVKMRLCDWRDFEAERAQVIEKVKSGAPAVWPFQFLHMADDPAAQRQCALTCARTWYPASPDPLWRGERYGHGKIRLAYISADFHDHPMPRCTAGLFEAHDRAQFEIIAIAMCEFTGSAIQQRLRNAFDRFIVMHGQSDRAIAALLREMEIDIAVDLMGYTTFARTGIFARKPAPVQVNFLGYPGTMVADYIDYMIVDRAVIPEGGEKFYTEALALMPATFFPTDPKKLIAGAPSRAECGLPENAFVFCSFNGLQKHTPEFFDVWMRLLKVVEGSVLWLLDGPAEAGNNLKAEAEKRGVESARLIFAPRTAPADHLARQANADLFLDSLPYNAHTTATDALWAGLPVLTCAGASMSARVAASLLAAVGLPELVTGSLEDYENLALALARTPQRLAGIRARLIQNRGAFPLFDTARYARNLESAYRTMWERAQRGEKPESFAVTGVGPRS